MPKSLNPEAYPPEYLTLAQWVLENQKEIRRKMGLQRARYLQADYHAYGRALEKSGSKDLATVIQKTICRVVQANLENPEEAFLVIAPRSQADETIRSIVSSMVDELFLEQEIDKQAPENRTDILGLFK